MKSGVTVTLCLMFLFVAAIAVSGCTQKGESQVAPQTSQQTLQQLQEAAQQAEQAMRLPEPEQQAAPAKAQEITLPKVEADYIVKITAEGFDPGALAIKAGQTVAFVNVDATKHWPASAAHPTHDVYPGSGISKCGTPEAATIFDACTALGQGEAFTFRFDKKGTWGYHDHWTPTMKGTVVVE
ncbi:hypothetical protein HYU17_05740 [Candidatus Woesearchaeota archaeon]|nr:hypothetical protein [Candidatus Woesearchaeota archaeon]